MSGVEMMLSHGYTPTGCEIVVVAMDKLMLHARQAVFEGFNWGCQCGESFKTAEGAESCRKCRRYIADEDRTFQVFYTPWQGKHNAHVMARYADIHYREYYQERGCGLYGE